MKLNHSTELMKNQKAAQVLPPQSEFAALQTSGGSALFFSIGDDGAFYLTAEKVGQKTGWQAVDLSADLSALNGDNKVQAKTFAVSQSVPTNTISMAVAVRFDGDSADSLYVLSGLPDADDAEWHDPNSARKWTARPYDAGAPGALPLDVAYLRLSQTSQSSDLPDLMVGKREKDSFIQNYTVQIDLSVTSGIWKQFETAENFDNLMGMELGKTPKTDVGGFYLLKTLSGGVSLTYTPLKGIYGSPTVTKLQPPQDSTSIATAPSSAGDGSTDLYVGADSGLYLYLAADQKDLQEATQIFDNTKLSGVRSLHVQASDTRVAVWGLKGTQLFYASCEADKVGDANAWTHPLPLLQNVEQIASLLNLKTGANQIFAHVNEGDNNRLIVLTQDPVTSFWKKSAIRLPALQVDDVVEFYTYTTHISVMDDNSLPLPNADLKLSANGIGYVYLNDRFVRLSDSEPLEIQSDATGVLTIVQETESLAALTYKLQLPSPAPDVDINPMSGPIGKMTGITSGSDLMQVQVTDENGQVSPLVPKDANSSDVDAVGQAIGNLVATSQNLPQDGSVQKTDPAKTLKLAYDPDRHKIWAVRFDSGGTSYAEGAGAMSLVGLSVGPDKRLVHRAVSTGNLDDAIEVLAGDLLQWLDNAWKDVESYFCYVVEGVENFFIQLGNKLYRFVLNSISTVAGAIEFVLKKINAFFEKLVQWLGFLFNWDDILRTHKALKNILKQYIKDAVVQIDSYEGEIANFVASIKQDIDSWAGLEETSGSAAGYAKSSKPLPGQHSPQANYGAHQLKSNVNQASSSATVAPGESPELTSAIGDLSDTLTKEQQILTNAFQTINDQIIAEASQLSIGEIIKRLLAVLAEALLESVANVAIGALKVIKILVEGLVDLLDTPFEIPVLSWLYRLITKGDELTLLDLVCLIVAIPVTIIFKLLTNQAPFPDNPFTQRVIDADSFATLQSLYTEAPKAELRRAMGGTSSTEAIVAVEEPPQAAILKMVLHLAASAGGGALMVLSPLKRLVPPDKTLWILHGICFFPATGPNIAEAILYSGGSWYKTWGGLVYGMTSVQKMGDMFAYKTTAAAEDWKSQTKWVDLVLGFGGITSVIGSLVAKQDAHTIIAAIGSSFWNLNRILSPFDKDPKAFEARMVLIGLYSLLQIIQAALDLEHPSTALS